MARHLGWTLAVALVCTPALGAAAPALTDCGQDRQGQKPPGKTGQRGDDHPGSQNRGPEHPRIRWWEDPKWRAEIGFNDRQAAQIKEIFETTMVQLKADRAELDKLEATLSQTIKDDRSDIGTVTQQVDRVENLRAQMQKTRVLMIYRMHRVLTPEQRARFQVMFERLQAEKRQNDPKRH